MAAPSVPYYRQAQGNYCGAACLKMVIEAVGQKSESQAKIYNSAHSHGTLDPGSNWASPPDGIEFVLEDQGNVPPASATVHAMVGEAALTRRMIWSLLHHRVPPIVLTLGWAHWVVMVDCDISAAPATVTDDSYDIKGVMIHDPAPEDGEDEPPPPKYVTFNHWKRNYLDPVPAGHWLGDRIAVGVFTA